MERHLAVDRRKERGSTVVEAALGLLFFLTFICGIMDFGRAIWTYNTLSYAAAEGARYAIVHGGESDFPATATQIEGIVESSAAGLNPAYVDVLTTWEPDNTPGNIVQVTASQNFSSIVPLLPSGITLTSTSRMTIHH